MCESVKTNDYYQPVVSNIEYGRCHATDSSVLCRVYTRTHVVAQIHLSRTSNLYPDTYMSTDTCRRIHVDGYKLLVRDTCRLYLGDIITIHLCHGRLVSVCIQQQTGDKLATILSPIYKIHVDGDKWIQVDTTCIRHRVS